jgi:hypothetical protein
MRAAFRRQYWYSYASAEETSRARSVSPRLVNLTGDLSPSASPSASARATKPGTNTTLRQPTTSKAKHRQHLDCAMRTIS